MKAVAHWWGLGDGVEGPMKSYGCMLLLHWVGLMRARSPFYEFVLGPRSVLGLWLLMILFLALTTPALSWIGFANDGIVQGGYGLLLFGYLGYASGRGGDDTHLGQIYHRRGAVVGLGASLARRSRAWSWRRLVGARAPAAPRLTLAGERVAPQDETKHFKMVGTTGTGKSTAIRELLTGALQRGDRAVIADPDGGYLAHFFDAARGDVILNPFHAEGMKWHLLGEISKPYDVDQLARSLIPDSGGSDRTWSDYARTFFIAVIRQVLTAKVTDDEEVYRLLSKAPHRELAMLLKGTVAGPFLEEGNEKMFGSVRSVAASALRVLEYTSRQPATAPFSVRQWVRQGAQGGARGVLFLPYKAGEIAALRSVISAWMRIAIFEAMDQPAGDQRLWFVIDELDALGEIDGLKDALARLRKFGGRCVLGFQSISQVSATYGKGAADTIVENCGNTLILRCSASEQGGTSQFASRLIGQREVVHTTQSTTHVPDRLRPSTTTSEQRSIEPAVMASEIERLGDLSGFLKLASVPDWMRVRLGVG